MPCEHLRSLTVSEPNTPNGCEECLAMGAQWVHLRLCMACGHVGCCDSSPHKHATKHYHSVLHPVIQSYEPGESWAFCYAHDDMVDDVGSELNRSY